MAREGTLACYLISRNLQSLSPFYSILLLNRPDKYDTVQVVELLQQLLAHGGYYDEGLEFVRVERVQVRLRVFEDGKVC